MNNLKDLEKFSSHLKSSPKMPAFFIGHGSPMNAIEDNEFVQQFKKLGEDIPTPQAIICVSAHWLTQGTKVTAMPNPRTIHDFGGFPRPLFEVQYPAPGNPELAKTTQEILRPFEVELDEHWGLDHGSWTVLRHIYPEANIPVIELSIDYRQPLSFHFDLAKRLASLRHQGVLIIGSGNIVHNLRYVDFKYINHLDHGYDWAFSIREKVNERILEGNFQDLINVQQLGKDFTMAVPSYDHYLPLIYSLALKDEQDEIELFNDYVIGGSLSMTSVKISAL